MTKYQKAIKFMRWSLLAIIVIACTICGHLLSLTNNGGAIVPQSSLAYYVFISPVIRNMPLPPTAGKPRYSFVCEVSNNERVCFDSTLPKTKILTQLRQYLASNGYQQAPPHTYYAEPRSSHYYSKKPRSKEDVVEVWVGGTKNGVTPICVTNNARVSIR